MEHEAAVLKSISGETMALLGVAATGRVDGLLLELTVEQRYRNPSTANVEAVYTFPLPSRALLLDFGVTLAGKELIGVVVERKAAEAQYEEAIDKGDSAIMLERLGNGLFCVNLGNLMAGEEATIRYRYAELLRFDHGSVRITVPTVVAPRYGDPAAAGLQLHQAPATDLGVSYPFTLSLEVRGAIAAGTIASPSHPIATVRTTDGVTVTLARTAALDRDFVLTVAGLPAQSLAAIAKDGEGYVALASVCVDVPPTATELPLCLKLVVDCSGSMGGDSIAAAKRALHRILAGLTPSDRFSYTRFGSHVVHAIDALIAADAAAIRRGAQCVARTDADLGGTEMQDALRAAFALGGAEGAADVLLVTDGEVWGADSLIAEARRAKQRVFVVGIGSAPAEGVLRRLADATGGACELVAPNEDAEAAILRMFSRLRTPRVERADVSWPIAPKWSTPIVHGLFGGETIHVFAGFDSQPSGEVTLRLVPADGGEPLAARATLPTTVADDAACSRMAAATRYEAADEETQLALALRYSLLTCQTNFLVVHARAEGEKATSLPELQRIAQMHAAGWGGVGSVAESVRSRMMAPLCLELPPTGAGPELKACYSAHFSDASDDQALSFSAESPSFADFIEALDRHFVGRGAGKLPKSMDALATLGLDMDVRAELMRLILTGHDEREVVRAFLAALEPHARALGRSRQLLRALRHASSPTGGPGDLRDRVAAIVESAAEPDFQTVPRVATTGSDSG